MYINVIVNSRTKTMIRNNLVSLIASLKGECFRKMQFIREIELFNYANLVGSCISLRVVIFPHRRKCTYTPLQLHSKIIAGNQMRINTNNARRKLHIFRYEDLDKMFPTSFMFETN